MNKLNFKDHSYRDTALEKGMGYPTDDELLMMILGTGIKNCPVQELACRVSDIVDVSTKDNLMENLFKLEGMPEKKVLAVAAALEYGKRKSNSTGIRIAQPDDLIPFVKSFSLKTKEYFLAVTLNGNHEIIQVHVIATGTVCEAPVFIRNIFEIALKENASALILVHNHPSGKVEPSDLDIEATKRIIVASEFLEIPVLDHIIINTNEFFSFKKHDLLFTHL